MANSQNLHLFDFYDSESDLGPILPEISPNESLELELLHPIDNLTENIKDEIDDSPKENQNSVNVIQLERQNRASVTNRASSNIEMRMESVLAELIGQRIQTKALPLALRKRLMYEQSLQN